MDFSVHEDVQALTALVREIGEQLVTPDSLTELDTRFGPGTEDAGWDQSTARFHEPLWRALVDAGVPAALAPESADGAALGVVAEALVLRELGRVLAPVPLASAVQASWLLDAAWLSDSARAVASGSAIAAISSREYAFGGIDWAPIADLVVLIDSLDDSGTKSADPRAAVWQVEQAQSGESFRIERTIPVDYSCAGIVHGAPSDSGAESAPGYQVESLTPTAAELLSLRQRVHLAAYQWGVVEAALERTANYASEREQFGRPIGTFQAVASRLADGMIDVDAVRLSTLRAAYELDHCNDQPGPAVRDAVATAHFWACEAGHRLAHSAVHIHGGVGLDRSEPLHRYFLAAKAGEFKLGGATSQLLNLGSLLVESGDPWAARV